MASPRGAEPGCGDLLASLAARHGFDDIGIAPCDLPQEKERLHAWLDAGYAGGMQWLTRNREIRLDLRERFPWAKSVLVVRKGYPAKRATGRGLSRHVSVYAQGADYHDELLPPLQSLATELVSTLLPEARWHAYVDTGPALERQLAAAAGIGWLGKNGLLLSPRAGSFAFLGIVVLELELEPTAADAMASCGGCDACQPACPTDAFVEPGVLDSRRCISYLTIEHRGPIERSLRPGMGEWLFGCDLCQTACPFNHRQLHEVQQPSALDDLDLPQLLALDEAGFRERFRSTPLWRPRREGLLRNALIVAGNLRAENCRVPAMRLLRDPSDVLREAASWMLGSLGGASAIETLMRAHSVEEVEWVRQAMRADLDWLAGQFSPQSAARRARAT